MYPVKTPRILRWPYPELSWKVDTEEKEVFLTFDDGPIPEVTSWVMDQLDAFDAKAMFFLVGENVKNNPEEFKEILQRGYKTGNHTYNHLNGWNTDYDDYIQNTQKCAELVDSHFFRPPHGRITKKQIKALKDSYKLVMWDVLSGDFDQKLTPQDCVNNVLDNVQPGSIIVFHDSLKAWPRLKEALPLCLSKLKEKGYRFSDLEGRI